jgi:hypothetical protein
MKELEFFVQDLIANLKERTRMQFNIHVEAECQQRCFKYISKLMISIIHFYMTYRFFTFLMTHVSYVVASTSAHHVPFFYDGTLLQHC